MQFFRSRIRCAGKADRITIFCSSEGKKQIILVESRNRYNILCGWKGIRPFRRNMKKDEIILWELKAAVKIQDVSLSSYAKRDTNMYRTCFEWLGDTS